MLDRIKVLKAFEEVSSQLFVDHSDEIRYAQELLLEIKADPYFSQKVLAAAIEWGLPHFSGLLETVYPVTSFNKPYHIVSVDGSQIYPDKHQGVNCFLINIGMITLSYGTEKGSSASFTSKPTLFTESMQEYDESVSLVDLVNAKREAFELQAGFDTLMELKGCFSDVTSSVVLYDGSLVFWHLDGKELSFRNSFLRNYCTVLEQCEKAGLFIASYLSAPRGKDLVLLLHYLSSGYSRLKKYDEKLKKIVDLHIMSLLLPSGTRSALFKSNSPIVADYPLSVCPYFFYMNVGYEIVRIEVPAYIAQSEEKVGCIAQIIFDQVQKGTGYPVVLSEAHERAVVKGADRDFFYYCIEKYGILYKKQFFISEKQKKKRAIPF